MKNSIQTHLSNSESALTESHQVLRKHFENIAQGEAEKSAVLWHKDAVMEFPFATPPIDPALVPPRLEGKQAIMAFWQAAAGGLKPGGEMKYKLIQPLQDPEWCVAMAQGEFQTADGRDYHNKYCLLARVKNGLLVEYYEYSNPLISLDVFNIAIKE